MIQIVKKLYTLQTPLLYAMRTKSKHSQGAVNRPVTSKKLQEYEGIKAKEKARAPALTPEVIQKYYQDHRCSGCNSLLQTADNTKYGFIDKKVFAETVDSHKHLLEHSYGAKVANEDSSTMELLREVEQELGVKIFNNETKKMEKLDSVEVLLRLQEKMDRHEEEHQSAKRMKKTRRELLCYRCYTLKHHNRLPSEYDNSEGDYLNSKEVILNKLFNKHKTSMVLYVYLIDVLDVLGSFQEDILFRLLSEKKEFCVVVNKLDVLNDKYLNKHLLLEYVKSIIHFQARKASCDPSYAESIRVIMVSNVTRDGLSKLEKTIEESKIKKIQLLGMPNTGKTTILNSLAKLTKPVSKIPGTTIHITEHSYKKDLLIYDMPGLHIPSNLYNLVDRPNSKSLLTWNKLYSPPVMERQAIFFGGKVEI